MKHRMNKVEVKQELHQHTDKKGVPFGKAHPIEALHKNIITRYNHNITLLTEVIMAGGIQIVDLRCRRYTQELPQ